MPTWNDELLRLINLQWSHPLLDWLMPAMASFKALLPFLAVLILVVAWRGGRRARMMLLCLGIAVGIGDAGISNPLKKTFRKDRPHEALKGIIIRDLGPGRPPVVRLFKPPEVRPSEGGGGARNNSFPSSHTVNMFACATVMAFFYRGWGCVFYILAFAVAYSRIYVGAHWPADIPPSIGIGLLVGLFTVKAMEAMARRWPALRWPGVRSADKPP